MAECRVMSVPERLMALTPTIREPEPMWEMALVARAFRLTVDAVGRLVPGDCKRRYWPTVRDWRFKKCLTLINRAGVERIAIRYSREHSRGELMAALDAGAARDDDYGWRVVGGGED